MKRYDGWEPPHCRCFIQDSLIKPKCNRELIMNAEVYVGVVWLAVGAGVVIASRRSCFNVPEGFYGLLYRHGKSLHRISPGRHHFWRRGYSVRLVDMRKTALNVPTQQLLSADHAPLKVSAVLMFQIIQAETAVHDVQDYELHLSAAVQSALRSVIGVTPLEELLNQRWDIGQQLLAQVQPKADRIGIVVHAVEVREVMLLEKVEKDSSVTV
jgi:regulator of protease activity HflC (stomatin/prohibitin superfamily)